MGTPQSPMAADASGLPPITVDVQGWLTKRGALKKSWKMRFHCLDIGAQKLRYYKKDPSAQKKPPLPIATVNLRVYEFVFLCAEATHNKKHEFAIASTGLRTFYMAAKSAEERDMWVDAFKRTGMTLIVETEKLPPAMEKSGYLLKLGEFHRTWRRRFMVLSNFSITYHESQEDAECGHQSGQFLLSEYESIDLVPESEHGQKFEFSISAPFRRSYYIAATSEQELMSWVEAITRSARLNRSVEIDRLMKREFLAVSTDTEGTYQCIATKDDVPPTVVLPPDATISYRVHVVGGDQRFLLRLSPDLVSFISRSTVKSFPYSQVYSYKFAIEDNLPVATFHPRIPNSRKCKVYKIVVENERILAHLRGRFEGMVQLVIEAAKMYEAVIAPHTSRNADEVSVEIGDNVTVVKESGADMLLVRKTGGVTGLLPKSCIAPRAAPTAEDKKQRRLSKVPVRSSAAVDEVLGADKVSAKAEAPAPAAETAETPTPGPSANKGADGADPSSSDLDSSTSSYSSSSKASSSSASSSD
eukprot:c10243_g1_i1.p2 GENE.c10243_g1_i1~~c10243_g1_i1.p2  ORF type:complete len:529 (+),score=115.07 c10243_g1_i1:2-1588(+)